jgi:hypothetical protein
LSVAEKKEQIDTIMAAVPKETISQLPLPHPMEKLSDPIQRDIRKIIYDFKYKWNERLRQLRQYIRTLSKPDRRMLRTGWLKIDEVPKGGAKADQKKIEELVLANLPSKIVGTTPTTPLTVKVITPKVTLNAEAKVLVLEVEGVTQTVPLMIETTTPTIAT